MMATLPPCWRSGIRRRSSSRAPRRWCQITSAGEPVLIRNYDYDPRLFEATVYRSRWSSRRVVGTGDCLWGLVDGVNDGGLAVSLTFGGRREVGDRVRHPDRDPVPARGVRRRGRRYRGVAPVPHQLSYNVTLCDRSGRVGTVFVAPDRPALGHRPAAHHESSRPVEWPEHAAWVKASSALSCWRPVSVRRGRRRRTGRGDAHPAAPCAGRGTEGFATLYTAAYRPASGRLTYHWPDRRVPLRLDEPARPSFPLNWTIRTARNIRSPDALDRRLHGTVDPTCASGPWRSVEFAPPGRADDGRSGGEPRPQPWRNASGTTICCSLALSGCGSPR